MPVTPRRRFITGGAAVGLGAAAMLATREAHAGPFTPVNVKDPPFQAVGDGEHNDAPNIQQALNTGLPVYVPPGLYLVAAYEGMPDPTSALLSTSKDVVMFGDGPDVSRILVSGPLNGMVFWGQHNNSVVDQLVIANVGLFAKDDSCETAIVGSWTVDPATFALGAHALVENVTVSVNDLASRFRQGMRFSRPDNSRILNCHLVQQNQTSGARGDIGIYFQTRGADAQIVGCQFQGQAIGVQLDGGISGIRITHCSFLGNTTGIYADGRSQSHGMDWVEISGCHFDVYQFGVDSDCVQHLQVHNNYFLAEAAVGNPPPTLPWDFHGVRMRRTVQTSHDWLEDSLIAANVFHRHGSFLNSYPISISGFNAQHQAQKILIDGNRVAGLPWTAAAVLGANTTDIIHTATNRVDNGEAVQNTNPANQLWGQSLAWTPTVTFEMPGNLSLSYAAQTGEYVKNGRSVCLSFTVVCTPVHSGASGQLLVTGLPFPAIPAGQFQGAMHFGGLSLPGYTAVTCRVLAGGAAVSFVGSGSGLAPAGVLASHVPSGGQLILVGSVTYTANA